MNNEIIKPTEQNPQGYGPKMPEILNLAKTTEFINAQKAENGMNQFELCKFGPYRFIGKSVYARAGKSSNVFGYMWSLNWVFDELDKLSDYATDEKNNSALLTWEWYNNEGIPHFDIFCGPSKLLGYTVGRFMKPDTPVPEGMDYFDIPETYVAKGWFDKEKGDEETIVKQAISNCVGYSAASWRFMVEVEAENSFGYYIACDQK